MTYHQQMIPKQLIKKAERFAYSQSKKHQTPSISFIDLSNEKGQKLAKFLKANKDIVFLGTMLMDCRLGFAKKIGRRKDHIKISEKAAKELLSQFPKLDKSIKENILHCIRQHHGVKKFYSLEAEICCNADCYRFASIKGVIAGIKYSHNMNLKEVIDLYLEKADEKWNALSLDICKKELEPQYKIIKKFLKQYKD